MSLRVALDDFNSIPDLSQRRAATPSHDFLANTPEYDTSKDYLGPLLHGGYRLSIAAKMGVGKTSLLMEMGGAVARGGEFLGFKGAGVEVLYVNLEMGAEQIGDAMRSARLPHENFYLLHMPNGMAIDDTGPRGEEDRAMLADIAANYPVVILDPWYQMLAAELPDTRVVGEIVRWLQSLQKHAKHTCFVFGKHAQENAEQISTGAISGFKVFERNSDVIVGMERISGDASRLRWLKNRSPRLAVKHGETWQLKWERGVGFSRTDEKLPPAQGFFDGV